jgi:HD domain
MPDSRTNRLRARVSGNDAVGAHSPAIRRRRPQDIGTTPAESRRVARAAAEIADGMLHAAGADTASHSHEVERIALRIADRLGLSGVERQNVGVTARLHDIGKVALPPALLRKPSQPTAAEWKLIHNHTIVGERILRSVEELRDIAPWVRHSHERWDGNGYPDGLTGGEIPLISRIVFCADAFHAICTDRPYSRGRSISEALAEVRRCAGTQFEPGVVAALTDVVREAMYGPVRLRRQSHARLSMLLVVAVTLGGSLAAGIASKRDSPSPEPIQRSAPPALPAAPASLKNSTPRLAPDAVPRGGVAGAFTGSKSRPAGNEPDRPKTEGDRALEGELPPPPPPVTPPSEIGSVTGTASEIGTRLHSILGPPKEEWQPADAGESPEPAGAAPEAPADDEGGFPGLESLSD